MTTFTPEELHLIRRTVASDLRKFHGPRQMGHEMHKCPETCFFELQPDEIRVMQGGVGKCLEGEE